MYHLKSKLLAITALCALGLQSCSDDDGPIKPADAADLINTSIAKQTGGLADELDPLVTYLAGQFVQMPCGEPQTTSIEFARESGDRTGSFVYNWIFLKNCSPDTSLNWTGTFSGTYDAPLISGNTSGSRNWLIADFAQADTTILLNGTVNRSGNQVYKKRNNTAAESSLSHQFENLQVTRNTKRIIAGTAQSTVSIETENGDRRTFNGFTTFHADGTATLVIEGENFTIKVYR